MTTIKLVPMEPSTSTLPARSCRISPRKRKHFEIGNQDWQIENKDCDEDVAVTEYSSKPTQECDVVFGDGEGGSNSSGPQAPQFDEQVVREASPFLNFVFNLAFLPVLHICHDVDLKKLHAYLATYYTDKWTWDRPELLLNSLKSINCSREKISKEFFEILGIKYGVKDAKIISTEAVPDMEKLLWDIKRLRYTLEILRDFNERHIHLTFDTFYWKLNISVKRIESRDPMWVHFDAFVKRTQESHYSKYHGMKLFEAYEVRRLEDEAKPEPVMGNPNKRLLAFGLPVSNSGNILRRGFDAVDFRFSQSFLDKKLFPFNSSITSAAEFCWAGRFRDYNKGIIFMCEVNLGETKVVTSLGKIDPQSVANYNSILVEGAITPAPNNVIKLYSGADFYTGPLIARNSATPSSPRSTVDKFYILDANQIRLRSALVVQVTPPARD